VLPHGQQAALQTLNTRKPEVGFCRREQVRFVTTPNVYSGSESGLGIQHLNVEAQLEPSPIEIVYRPDANRERGFEEGGSYEFSTISCHTGTGMNELRAQPDNLPWKESGVIRNSHKIRDLIFWQANCIQSGNTCNFVPF